MINPDAKKFLDITDQKLGEFFVPFTENILPAAMAGVSLAYQLDGQPQTGKAEERLTWLAAQADDNNFIFLKIAHYMMGLLPEDYKER